MITWPSWGLNDVRFETWPFGRGWELQKFAFEMTEPRYTPLLGYPDAWSASTKGDVVGAPMLIAGMSYDSLNQIRAKLKGAIVMTQLLMTTFIREDRINPTDPNAPPPAPAPTTGRGGRGGAVGRGGQSEAARIAALLHDAGVAAVLKPSRGEHGTLFLQTRDAGADAVPTVVDAPCLAPLPATQSRRGHLERHKSHRAC